MTWERWRPEIEKAADPAFHDIDDIERAIVEGRSQVWMLSDCCVITELVTYAHERVCQCTWAAGDLTQILGEMSEKIEAWAREQGCNSMLVESREGWARALAPLGYKPWSVTVRKPL